MAPSPQEHDGRNVQLSETNENVQPDDIVISGMSGTYANCRNINDLFENFNSKLDRKMRADTLWDYQHPESANHVGVAPNMEKFDAQFFRVHRKLGVAMDVMSRKLLEHAYQAIYDSGIPLVEISGKKVGVFTGATTSDHEKAFIYAPSKRYSFAMSGCSRSMYANRISYWLDAKGPSISVDAACSSSMVALQTAYEFMRRNMCDAAIVGAGSVCFHPHLSVHLDRLGMLCEDGKSRSFDKNGRGAVKSDAVSCIFLQKAKFARRIYAKVIHMEGQYTIDKDAVSKELEFGSMRPSKCLVDFWSDFYRKVDVPPQKVEYIEAYGSAVAEADLEELKAIEQVFCEGNSRPLHVGSAISNVGYTEAASGIASITKVLLAYHSGQIFANLHYETPQDQVKAIRDGRIRVVVDNQPFERTYVAVNNHSLSGLSYHLLLHGYQKPRVLDNYKTNIPRLVNVSGRIESNVSKIIDHLKSRPVDAEEIGLLHNNHRFGIKGHLARGYVVLDTNEEGQTVSLAEDCVFYPDIKRPVWFVYSGMGSQWAGMGAQLMRIPIFANAIEKCCKVLEPKGVDLMKILTEPDKTIYDNILNSFVGIAAVQIGLTDVLHELGIVPDNIIGHSVGELGCAYADGCFTAEEMILSAYSRGLVSVQTPFIRGTMAAVGLGYKDVIGLCPPEIEVACHNSSESSTISGPEDVMRAFVKKLTDKGVFAKEVPCSNIAYHSRYISKAGPGLRQLLNEVIKDPKPRSQKWVSTSVPQDRWDEPGAKYSSADYHTNNLLSCVLFEETSRLIPSNAVVIEVAPHGLLQAILKRSLAQNCVHVPLTRRGHSDPVTFLLDNIGKLYQAGLNPDIQVLYPKINYPVSTGTPMLSHLVEWMHEENWPLPKYVKTNYLTAGERNVLISIEDEEYKSVNGNVKNDIIMFPEAGMLVLVWETLAMLLGKTMNELSVRFSEVRFDSDVVMTDDEVSLMTVTIQKASGKFEITHQGNSLVSGCIRGLEKKIFRSRLVEPVEEEYVTSSEIYKLFYLKGYSYSGPFRSIYKSSLDFTKAELIWNGNWINFIDSLLQLNILRRNHNGISKIKYLQSMVINVENHKIKDMTKPDGEKYINAQITEQGVFTSFGGVEMKGITINDVPLLQSCCVTKKLEFIPYHPTGDVDVNTVVHVFLQILSENCPSGQVDAIEFVDATAGPTFGNLLETAAKGLGTVSLVYKCTNAENILDLEMAKNEHRNVLIGNNLLTNEKIQRYLMKVVDTQKFIMSNETSPVPVRTPSYIEVAAMKTPIGRLVLARLSTAKEAYEHISFISLPEDIANTSFLEHTRNNLMEDQRLILIADMPPPIGLIGLIRKWKTEPERNNLNLVITDTRSDADCDFKEQIRKNLAVNIYRNGHWGSEFYIPILHKEIIGPQTRLCSTAPGDLEALTWVEAPEKDLMNTVKVHYAGLTHYDVMKATGARPGTTQNDSFGMDFSGVNSRGERVMGVVACGALASAVVPDEELLWPVPDHWTLEDAATIPQPYTHAYYILKIVSNIKSGSRILVHCGAGALGQAIISIALGINCEIFTTVSSMKKKRLLKSLFPELRDDHILSSRDVSFEHSVMSLTKGKGCQYVVSCLNGELMQASMRCVKYYGVFVNVSLSQCYENGSLGMYYLDEDTAYYLINFSLIFDSPNVEIKRELRRLVSGGIASGQVRPLTRLVLGGREAPRAARLLAAGAHRGRLLLTPEPEAAQLRLALSDTAGYAVVCGEHELGLELVDRLIRRGAKKLVINYSQKNDCRYLRAKLHTWENTDTDIRLSSHDLQTRNGALDFLRESVKLEHIEGVFLVDETADSDPEAAVVQHIDDAARVLCPTLKYFVVLRPMTDHLEPKSQEICARRRLEDLPALFFSMPKLKKYGHRNGVGQSASDALDVLEISLRLNHRDVVTLASEETPKCDMLDKVGHILGINLKEVCPDTTLESLGLDFEKAEEVRNVIERRYKFPCSRQNLPDLTVGRLKEAELKLANNAEKKPTKLAIFFRNVNPDEMASSAELLVMNTITSMPDRSDEFLSKETYLILVPGMEGNHGVFSRLCERLKIFALCMQPSLDHPNETPDEVAKRFVKKLVKMIEFQDNFYLLGYSYGVLIAMEMAALLEQKGLRGTVFCIDSAPDIFSVQLETALGSISESELQNDIVDHMSTVIAGHSLDGLRDRLVKTRTWEEKVDTSLQHLRGIVHYSSQYLRKLMETAYGRIVEAKKYNPEHLRKSPISSKIILMRSTRQPDALANYPRDFGLSKYTRQPVEVHDLETEHANAPQNLRCTAIVHEHLDERLLEEFSKKNLCLTYTPSEVQYVNLSE